VLLQSQGGEQQRASCRIQGPSMPFPFPDIRHRIYVLCLVKTDRAMFDQNLLHFIQVKTTSPRKYFVRPNASIVQPWDSCTITSKHPPPSWFCLGSSLRLVFDVQLCPCLRSYSGIQSLSRHKKSTHQICNARINS
jgi:hypothetical protein